MKSGIINLHTIAKSQNELFKNIFQQICGYTDAIPLTFLKSNKLANIIKKNTTLIDIEKDNWDEVKKEIKNFLKQNSFDRIYVVGLPLYDTLNYDKFDSWNKLLEKTKEDNQYSFNYCMTKTCTIPQILFIDECVNQNIEIISLIYEPQMPSLKKIYQNSKIKEYYILNKNDKNLKYLPFYERAMFINNEDISSNLKINELLFNCTVLTDDRKWILNYKNVLEKYNCKLITNLMKESVSQSEYYDQLSHSKYTIVIPSFDVSSFSIIRLLEALSVNCLPFIYKDCNLNDLKETFPKLFRFIEDFDLILNDFSELENKIKLFEEVREDIIEYFNENKNEILNNILNNNYLKEIYKEI